MLIPFIVSNSRLVEANEVVDILLLASLVHSHNIGLHIMHTPPIGSWDCLCATNKIAGAPNFLSEVTKMSFT